MRVLISTSSRPLYADFLYILDVFVHGSLRLCHRSIVDIYGRSTCSSQIVVYCMELNVA